MSEEKITLKCPVCGHEWSLSVEDAQGEDNPSCPQCLGPGLLKGASA